MYGKIFDSMYDGTISANWQGLVTFQQMIVLCDADGAIDMTPPAISRRTGIPLDIIEAGIEYLEAPDKWSRTPDFDGARIVRLDEHRPWGWFIVNHEKYKTLVDADTVREQTRLRVQKHRDKKKEEESKLNGNGTGVTLTGGNGLKRYTDTDTDIKSMCARFDEFWNVWPKKERKQPALVKWKSKKLDRVADEIIKDVIWRKDNYKQWQDGIYMHPATYLNQQAWEDEKTQEFKPWENIL